MTIYATNATTFIATNQNAIAIPILSIEPGHMQSLNLACHPIEKSKSKYTSQKNAVAKVATHSRETHFPPARKQRIFQSFFIFSLPYSALSWQIFLFRKIFAQSLL